MNQSDDRTGRPVIACPFSSGGDFEEALSNVEAALQAGEVDRALDMLSALQVRYARASRLFDLMGEALLKKGRVEAARRCKTLYEALRSVLGPGWGEAGPVGFVYAPKPSVSSLEDETEAAAVPAVGETPELGPSLPVTEAMADELLRQGHTKHALRILDALLAETQDNDALLHKADAARKRIRQGKKAALLEGWLSNLSRLKPGS
jgi:hypothetical protein